MTGANSMPIVSRASMPGSVRRCAQRPIAAASSRARAQSRDIASRCRFRQATIRPPPGIVLVHSRLASAAQANVVLWADFASATNRRQFLVVDPGAEDRALRTIPALDQPRPELNFEDRDRGQELARGRLCARPCHDSGICFFRAPKLRDDIGVEQEHQPSSAGLKIPLPMRGGSKSKSAASPG